MSWQAQIFDRLRDREWHQIGELFELVQPHIPLHNAMRCIMHPKYGRTELPTNNEARWRFFLTTLATIGTECDRCQRGRKYTDHVRLRYVKDRSCETCGGPVIKATWQARSSVACLACEAGPCEEIPQVEPVAVPIPVPVPVAVEHTRPSPTRREPRALAELSSLREVFDEFELTANATDDPLPRFAENPKLRRMIHRALEAGALDEYRRVLLPAIELRLEMAVYPPGTALPVVWQERAQAWIDATLLEHQRRRWGECLIAAFSWGCCAVFQIANAGRLGVIGEEMARLHRPRAPPKERKQRWRTAFRNVWRWRYN